VCVCVRVCVCACACVCVYHPVTVGEGVTVTLKVAVLPCLQCLTQCDSITTQQDIVTVPAAG
jgi:hypothetical protein